MRLAYHTAIFTRWNTGKGGKPFPKLERLLVSGRKSKAPQTPEQMMKVAEALTVAFGGTIVRRKKED